MFDLLDYKKDDFVRRGARKGVVNVTFESGLDEREYRVYRDTGTGYYVYDPQLKTRIADKKEEVQRFLWQHLGVEAGTDLEALFRRAIGVPQGTFTAIFLETPTERKKAFDKLLKVEEYRQGAEKLKKPPILSKINWSKPAIKSLFPKENSPITSASKTILKIFQRASERLNETLEEIEKEVAEKSESVKQFDETETKVNELKSAFDKLNTEKTKAEIILAQKENEKKRSEEAAAKIKAVEADYKTHIEALGKIKELERERGDAKN